MTGPGRSQASLARAAPRPASSAVRVARKCDACRADEDARLQRAVDPAAATDHHFAQLAVMPPAPAGDTVEVSEPDDAGERDADAMAERARARLSSGDAAREPVGTPAGGGPRLARAVDDDAAPEAGSFIVEDDAAALLPGQMRKGEFLKALREDACAASNRELARVGRDTEGCPYLERWFDYYEKRDARHVERAVRKYAPDAARASSAAGYIPIVSARAAQAARQWATTGELPEMPDGMGVEIALGGGLLGAIGGAVGGALSAIGGLFFKADSRGAPGRVDRGALASRLGPGQPLDGGAQARMSAAFGYDFGAVRVHTDRSASEAASALSARAFTLGAHVAFAAGQYRPGNPLGDALLAHELAHVVQQGGARSAGASPSASDALEQDADASAEGAVRALWDPSSEPRARRPRLRGGLQLQRCSKDKPPPAHAEAPAQVPEQAPPKPPDLDAMDRAAIEGLKQIYCVTVRTGQESCGDVLRGPDGSYRITGPFTDKQEESCDTAGKSMKRSNETWVAYYHSHPASQGDDFSNQGMMLGGIGQGSQKGTKDIQEADNQNLIYYLVNTKGEMRRYTPPEERGIGTGPRKFLGKIDTKCDDQKVHRAVDPAAPADRGFAPLAPRSASAATLAVSEPGDAGEREADAMAERARARLSSGDAAREPVGTPAGGGPELQRAAAPEAAPAEGSFVVEDDAATLLPGQMRKHDFLAALRDEVCAASNRELARAGRSTEGCPYLDRWFGFYETRDARQVERALRKYAPGAAQATSAAGYIPIVAERAARGARQWVDTGKVPELPEGVAMDLPGGGLLGAIGGAIGGAVSAIGGLLFRAETGGARGAVDRGALEARLGRGQPLDGGAQARMSSAFGYDFGAVRVHADGAAAQAAAALNARAFTLGAHVAFGTGQYRPGDPQGDALLAHELAHVVQQDGGATAPRAPLDAAPQPALEHEADVAAAGAVAALHGDRHRAAPRARRGALTGLALQRCSGGPAAAPQTAFDRYLLEGNDKLKGIGFGVQWGEWCAQKPLAAGGKEGYDPEFWTKQEDPVAFCKLVLRQGKSPAAAIRALFDDRSRRSLWLVDCGQFVELAHLYALLKTSKSDTEFDQKVGGTLELKRLNTTGIKTKTLWGRRGPDEMMRQFDQNDNEIPGVPARSVDDVLKSAPFGSRVEFTNGFPLYVRIDPNYRHENTMKVADNAFAAHPFQRGVLSGGSNIYTKEELVDLLAAGTQETPKETAKRYIYISEIAYYDEPTR